MFWVKLESPFDFHPLLTRLGVGDVVDVVSDIDMFWFFGGREKKEFDAEEFE